MVIYSWSYIEYASLVFTFYRLIYSLSSYHIITFHSLYSYISYSLARTLFIIVLILTYSYNNNQLTYLIHV